MSDDTENDFGLGDIIEGNLKLTEIIGEGATGQVFLAQSIDMIGKKYAVKRLDKQNMEPIDFEDYRREIIFMKKLSGHANIVQYINHFESINYFYLVLEYCETDLFDAIFLRCGFPPFLPENILISADGGQAKLADFGLATTDKYSDEFGVGSGRYLAPECLQSENDIDCYCTPAADVWAVGVLLINMISGRSPWHEATFTDACFNAYINVDASILKNNLNLSEELDHFLRHKVFNMDPEKRCQVMEFNAFVSSQTDFVHKNSGSVQLGFVEDGEKIQIVHTFIHDSDSNTQESKECMFPLQPKLLFSGSRNNMERSFSSNFNASIIGSMDGCGLLKMSSADITTPFIESTDIRVNLAKKMGLSYVSSLDKLANKKATGRRYNSKKNPE